MALIQLNTVEEAIEALIVRLGFFLPFYQQFWSYFLLQKMHNFQLNENTHLRVSFSKATIKDN